jgi:hypothetical protein
MITIAIANELSNTNPAELSLALRSLANQSKETHVQNRRKNHRTSPIPIQPYARK